MLLTEPEILRLVRKHRRLRNRLAKNAAREVLRRLVLAPVNDAARLALSEEIPPELDGMELYGISEIKKVKGGGVEVKLINRLEAIRLMYELESRAGDQKKTDSFFAALKNTPSVLTEGDEVNGDGGI